MKWTLSTVPGKNEYSINTTANTKKSQVWLTSGWNVKLAGKCWRDCGGCVFLFRAQVPFSRLVHPFPPCCPFVCSWPQLLVLWRTALLNRPPHGLSSPQPGGRSQPMIWWYRRLASLSHRVTVLYLGEPISGSSALPQIYTKCLHMPNKSGTEWLSFAGGTPNVFKRVL